MTRHPVRNLIGRLLVLRGWSDGDLAVRTGLSRTHVNRLRNRRVRPTLRDGLLISTALDLPVEAVFQVDEARSI